MAHLSYEDSKKLVFKGLFVLGFVTLVEVFFSLLGKGHIISGLEANIWVTYIVGLIIIILSIYKAYYIVYFFMHMEWEVQGLRMSVILPMLLLVWAIIAFMQEGDSWNERRQQIKQKDELPQVDEIQPNQQQGELLYDEEKVLRDLKKG